MKITFLGTRANIETTTREHRKHSSLLVSYKGKEVMIDCGLDWLESLYDLNPPAIVLTHGHPDHAFGLENGAPCPVYATEETLEIINKYELEHAHKIEPYRSFELQGMTFTAYPVEHSTRAPAAAYNIEAGTQTIFYAPDVVYIHEREKALTGCNAYIGDGATVTTNMVRKQDGNLIGHTPVPTQLTWCKKFDIPKAWITHCGSEIVEGGGDIKRKIDQEAKDRGVEVVIANDGMEVLLR